MSRALSNLCWHDGNLVSILFGIDNKGRSTVQIAAQLYKNQEAPNRDAYQISCEGVGRFNSTLDATELKDNAFAGNISSGYLKDKTLWVYLSDGLIEVHAAKFCVIKC